MFKGYFFTTGVVNLGGRNYFMNFKVYILAVSIFVVGMVELIMGGILPLISADMNVSVSTAGQLTTVFALVLGVAAPILLALTAKVERKKLYLTSLFIFFISNLITYFSPNFTVLMIARVLTAGSAALLIILSLTMAAKLVPPAFQARAIGVITMGISASLVLGIPIGVLIGNAFGWRVIFLIIACLSLVAMLVIYKFIDSMQPEKAVPLREQFATLKTSKIITAHLVTVFMLAGHYMIYAYFTPFLQESLGASATMISIAYLVFGFAAVTGGGMGGWLSDKIGPIKSILSIVGIFAITLFILPASTSVPFIFAIVLIIWGMLSWALSPPQQTYLIQTAPESAAIQQSINTSALQLGIALGSALGGIVIQSFPVSSTAWFGGGVAIVAFLCAVYSIKQPTKHAESAETKGSPLPEEA